MLSGIKQVKSFFWEEHSTKKKFEQIDVTPLDGNNTVLLRDASLQNMTLMLKGLGDTSSSQQ